MVDFKPWTATRKAVRLDDAHHNDQLVLFEQVTICLHQSIIYRSVDLTRGVVELEQTQLAALAIDHPEVADDPGQQLGFPGVDQVVNLAFYKLAHLA